MPEKTPLRRVETPFRLNLEQQKKRAKELLKSALAGEPEAWTRFNQHHPSQPEAPKLADAQLVIARELGLPSWPRLKAHIAAMEGVLAGIGQAGPLDEEMKTLHIRCGSDIHDALRMAGFEGDFLEVSDPLVQGPVVASDDWLEYRADFIHDAFDHDAAQTLKGLLEIQERLVAAHRDYERVVIWSEHDSHDQLVLARCLAQFQEGGRPPVLELASVNGFPGSARFLGIGQLPVEALILIWQARQALSGADLALGARVWTALRQPDPRELAQIAWEEDGRLPDMRPALRRHLRELPWRRDGLSLTERLVLDVFRDAERMLGQAFGEVQRRDPLPTYGDLGFFDIVRAMLRATEPPLSVTSETEGLEWPRRVLRLTPVGEAILRGERDWLTCGPPQRWLGGVLIRPGGVVWRWDEASSTVGIKTS